jgi:AraC-like DNA-binding protein
MSEVAEKAGYSDLAAFSKAFKLKMGVSPKQYREKYKK